MARTKVTKEQELRDKAADAEADRYALCLKLAGIYAQKKGWDVTGWEALYLLFADKWGWTPSQVRSLTLDEISMFLDYFESSRS
jgi:hypothetical protein